MKQRNAPHCDANIWPVFVKQTHIYIIVYMKSSFPKPVKRHSKNKWACNANAKFNYYVLENSFSLMNKCVYLYIFMKSSFLKHDLWTWHCHCQLDFSIGAWRTWEKSFSYIYIQKCICMLIQFNTHVSI